MIETSEAYRQAITAGKRKIVPLAIIDLVDPDIVYGAVLSNGETIYSDARQIYDKKLELEDDRYATLEQNRFVLDGTTTLYPDNPEETKGEQGYLAGIMSNDTGHFLIEPFVELQLTNLSIMQAASVYFTGSDCDGWGMDFRFEVFSGDTVVYAKEITNNGDTMVSFDGFTVHDVTALRVIFFKWSLPRRFVRVLELLPGIYEKWDARNIYAVDVLQETALDCLTTPYGVCTLEPYNKDKRFNPFTKDSLFRSIEARQGIPVSYGVKLADGNFEYLPLGVYYQQSGGWETDAYGLTIQFKLVDIVGLIVGRDFVVPAVMPETLAGWIAAIVAHLGENFKECYEVDESIAQTVLTTTAEDIKNENCGQILRYVCMAATAFFRADSVTGKLKVEPLPETGGVSIDLNNMYSYPQNKAGDDIAQIAFRLADEANTEYVVSGTSEAADKSISISNPFIHTAAQADAVATHIMQFYGVTKFTVKGRGNMCCEVGDVDTVETGFGGTVIGRRYKQQLKFENGIVKNALSYLIAEEEVTGL